MLHASWYTFIFLCIHTYIHIYIYIYPSIFLHIDLYRHTYMRVCWEFIGWPWYSYEKWPNEVYFSKLSPLWSTHFFHRCGCAWILLIKKLSMAVMMLSYDLFSLPVCVCVCVCVCVIIIGLWVGWLVCFRAYLPRLEFWKLFFI